MDFNKLVNQAVASAANAGAVKDAEQNLRELCQKVNAKRGEYNAICDELGKLQQDPDPHSVKADAMAMLKGGTLADVTRKQELSERAAAVEREIRVLDEACSLQGQVLAEVRDKLSAEVSSALRPTHEAMVRRQAAAITKLAEEFAEERKFFGELEPAGIQPHAMTQMQMGGWDTSTPSNRVESWREYAVRNGYTI